MATVESSSERRDVYFETDIQYADGLTHEVADAFVVGTMLIALVQGEDMEVECVSDSLYYHFDTLIYLLGKVFKRPPIKLHANRIVHPDFAAEGVGAAFSGGVDSLCTVLNHCLDSCPEHFRLTHLTLFNVGAYGNDEEQAAAYYKADLNRSREFAQKVNMPLVDLDSNISSCYNHEDIFHFSLRLTLMIATGVLALQKLFRVYYIASSAEIDGIWFSRRDQGYYEGALVQLLSNHHLDILVAEHTLSRLEKTRRLADDVTSQQNLYVCAADINNLNSKTSYTKDTSPNCCECTKCVRTLLTLDVLGKLNHFSSRFDLNKWAAIRDREFARLYLNKSTDHFMEDIWNELKARGGRLTPKQMWIYRKMRLRLLLGRIRWKFGRIKWKICRWLHMNKA